MKWESGIDKIEGKEKGGDDERFLSPKGKGFPPMVPTNKQS